MLVQPKMMIRVPKNAMAKMQVFLGCQKTEERVSERDRRVIQTDQTENKKEVSEGDA